MNETTASCPHKPALRRILVPIDFSPGSHQALREAVRLARACGADLTLQTVIERREVNALSLLVRGNDVDEQLVTRFSEALERALVDAGGAGCAAQRIVTLGVPFAEVLAAGARIEADLVVIASRSGGPFDAILPLANTTYRVVRQAPCSVYCVPPFPDGAARRPTTRPPVLVPVDFSASSHAAAQLGAEIARNTKSPLVLLTVVDGAEEADEGAALGRLGAVAATLGVEPELVAVRGAPVASILRVAAEKSAFPVVIGSHGPGRGLRSILLGDTVYQVARQLQGGVLVVKVPIGAPVGNQREPNS